jgi:hypothetical protein
VSDGENDRSLAGWWTRVRETLQGRVQTHLPGVSPIEEDAVHPSRTLRPFLDAMRAIDAPVIVDFGPVIGSNVTFLGEQLFCKLHVEDLYGDIDRLTRAGHEDGLAAFLSSRLPFEAGSVDGVLAWDLFDYLQSAEAESLAGRLVTSLKPGGLVMALFSTVLTEELSFRKYVIVDSDHLRHRREPSVRRAKRVWLARDVERLLAPFEVAESHLLTHHQRETLLRQPLAGRKER